MYDRFLNSRITDFEMSGFRLRQPDRGFRLNNRRSVPVPNSDYTWCAHEACDHMTTEVIHISLRYKTKQSCTRVRTRGSGACCPRGPPEVRANPMLLPFRRLLRGTAIPTRKLRQRKTVPGRAFWRKMVGTRLCSRLETKGLMLTNASLSLLGLALGLLLLVSYMVTLNHFRYTLAQKLVDTLVRQLTLVRTLSLTLQKP